MMLFRFSLVLFAVVSFGCSGSQAQKKEQPRTPQCLSLCSNQFAACTEEYPGDFSACRADRADCEQACTEQKALERMDEEDGKEVIAPTDGSEDGLEPAPEPAPELDESSEDGGEQQR